MVSDDELTSEDMLIGRPVLEHLKIDTKTLLEKNRETLDGADCSDVGNPTRHGRGGYVSRVLDVHEEELHSYSNRPRAVHEYGKTEEDPFPNPTLLDLLDEDQAESLDEAIGDMIQRAKENVLPETHLARVEQMVFRYRDVFRTGLSSGVPPKFPPLVIALTSDAKPTKVRLRNYSKAQKEFMKEFVSRLVEKRMAYENPAEEWAAAPLLVPKPGPAKFRFTVDLRPVNRYTKKHQYPMPNLEQEISKLGKAKYFANFDLSHGYWQLPLHPDS